MIDAEFEAELRQQLGTDMVMIPREVLKRLQTVNQMIRESRAASMWSIGIGDGADIHQMDDDAAHIAAALDDGTDPEAKE